MLTVPFDFGWDEDARSRPPRPVVETGLCDRKGQESRSDPRNGQTLRGDRGDSEADGRKGENRNKFKPCSERAYKDKEICVTRFISTYRLNVEISEGREPKIEKGLANPKPFSLSSEAGMDNSRSWGNKKRTEIVRIKAVFGVVSTFLARCEKGYWVGSSGSEMLDCLWVSEKTGS